MKHILLLLLSFFLINSSFAQELKCRVSINTRQVSEISTEEKDKMRTNIQDFMNNMKWTEHVFGEEEKINVNIKISLTEMSSTTSFTASIQFMASRPVYNSTYTSPIFNFLEESVSFTFEANQVLEFDENSYTSNLTSVLAFYSYIIIGLDYDSFGRNGGTDFYQKAQNIVNTAQSSSDANWSSTIKENRYWLVENLLNSSYSGFRSCLYTYHRLGLDIMNSDASAGRKQIIKALEELEKVYNSRPNAYLLTIFFYAKSDELLKIFSTGQATEISEAVSLMKKMDPGNASDYDKLQSN